MNAALAWLHDAALVLGLILPAGCLVYGLLLALAPAAASRAAAVLNRSVGDRNFLQVLDHPRPSERFFYRHHRVFGSLILAGVIAFFFFYFSEFPKQGLAARLGQFTSRPLADALLDTLSGFLLAANALIGVIAIVVIRRPSLLKRLEAAANRWVSARGMETPYGLVDRFATRHPRLVGALVTTASLYLLTSLILITSR